MSMRTLSQVATGRDNNFNLLRVLAASGVIFSHAYPLGLGIGTPEPLEDLLPGVTLGHFCVLVFFATSGFFITASFERRRGLGDFLAARVLRIVPALLIMACTLYPLVGLLSPVGEGFWQVLPLKIAATLSLFADAKVALPGVFADLPYPRALNGSLWSLRFEVLCYAAVVLAGLLGVFRTRPAMLLILLLCLLAEPLIAEREVHPYVSLLSHVGLPFACGAGAYVFRDRLPLDWRLLAGLVIGTFLLRSTAAFFPVLALTITYGVLWAGYLEVPGLRLYNRLGDYSYGVYIYAFPIQQLLAGSGVTQPLQNAVLALLLSTCCAVLSWHLVERPSLVLRNHLPSLRKSAGSRKKAGRAEI